MKVYAFTEQSYPDAWFEDAESLRVNLPNKYCDPEIASRLYNRYLDEWMLADELGLNIIVNEHHATATCMSASVHLTLAILARQTKRARLLGLGTPIANRNDPLRIAEEMSIIDVISRGRLEMGFIKGVPYEIVPSNARPVRVMDRFWEAHDLILKAMTTRRRAVLVGGRILPISQRQHLAAPLSAAASAGVEHLVEPEQLPRARPARSRARHGDDRLARQGRVR